MTSNAARALDPLEFRFTDPEDVQRYGDRWYVFDDFNPVTNMIEWRPAEGKAPAAETAMPEPLALWDQPPTTSEPPDLVVLPTMPVAE
jgi:hypothetical protein